MVSPPFKLEMFTGSVCVLLTSVSLKSITIKLIYATTRSWEKKKKQNGGWKVSDADWFYFSFYDPSWFFDDPSWSESNFILFLFFLFDPNRSKLIRSDLFTCLAKMFVCPVPKISWWNGASELHISADLLCGITAAELHNLVDLLCDTTAA